MRYFIEVDKEVRGPYEVQDLKQTPGFGPESRVCSEVSTDTADWKPARAYADFGHSNSPHSKPSGILWMALGILCFLAIVPSHIALLMIVKSNNFQIHRYLFRIVSLILGAYGMSWMYRGLKLLAPTAEEAIQNDTRPPVLYLRSFQDDSKGVPVMRAADWSFPESEEQEIAAVFRVIGPVVAIGSPWDSLPILGASRLYVDAGDWQAKVGELMGKACIVLFRAGLTPGFWWEIQRAAKTFPLERAVFLLPSAWDEPSRKAFAQKLQETIGRPVPALPETKKTFGSIGAVLTFEPDGTPRTTVLSTGAGGFQESLALTLAKLWRERRPQWAATLEGRLKAGYRVGLILVVSIPVYLVSFLVSAFVWWGSNTVIVVFICLGGCIGAGIWMASALGF